MSWRGVLRAVPAAACLVLSGAGTAPAAELQLVDEFGSLGTGPGQLQAVEDLEVAPGGNLVVSDGGNPPRVQIFTPAGGFVTSFGSSGTGPGQFSVPFGLAIQNDGTIFVGDTGHGRVEVFSSAGTYLREFQTPVDFYADSALNPAQTILYLVDYQSGNIQRMSTSGANMGLIGSFGTGPGQFQRPHGIAVDSSGNLFVVDRNADRVEKLDPNGAFLDQFGGRGSGPGQMAGPVDIAIAPDGNVIVADTSNRRLQEFTPSGQFVASYDTIAGSPIPDFVPNAVTVAPSGDIYFSDGQANVRRILRVRAEPDTPTLGKDVNVAAVRGTVRVDTPGAGGFIVLEQASQIPVGSKLDTRKGTVSLTSARDRQGHTQTGQFSSAIFKVVQGKRSGGLTDLRLLGGNFSPCGSRRDASTSGLSKRVIRKLRARARRGRFRTRGRYSASTVRGTVWTTADRCDGTLTRVKRGSVTVRDLVRHRTVVVRAGHSYLAKAPGT